MGMLDGDLQLGLRWDDRHVVTLKEGRRPQSAAPVMIIPQPKRRRSASDFSRWVNKQCADVEGVSRALPESEPSQKPDNALEADLSKRPDPCGMRSIPKWTIGRRLPGEFKESPGPGPAACSWNTRSRCSRLHGRAPNFGRRDARRISGRLATPPSPSPGPGYMVPGYEDQHVSGGYIGIPLVQRATPANDVPAPGKYDLGSTLNRSAGPAMGMVPMPSADGQTQAKRRPCSAPAIGIYPPPPMHPPRLTPNWSFGTGKRPPLSRQCQTSEFCEQMSTLRDTPAADCRMGNVPPDFSQPPFEDRPEPGSHTLPSTLTASAPSFGEKVAKSCKITCDVLQYDLPETLTSQPMSLGGRLPL